jgi:hypothetical protein
MKTVSETLNNKKTLHEISLWFVTTILRCKPTTDAISVIFLAADNKYASERVPSDLEPKDRFLFMELGPSKFSTYQALCKKSSYQGDSVTNSKEASFCKSPSVSSTTKSGGLVVLSRDYQQLYATASLPMQKLEVMCAASFELKGQLKGGRKMKEGGSTCKSCRQLYQYNKISTCLEECFMGNKTEFLAKNPSIALAKFSCTNGKTHSLKV